MAPDPETSGPTRDARPRAVSRRATLAGSLAGIASLTGGSALAGPTRTRLPLQVFSASPTRVASLRRAVHAMRQLPPADPQSWWWQGAVHHLDMAAVPDFPVHKPMPSQADQDRYWRQCPHGLKETGANEFLGWHAAYLLYFEAILRIQSGDETLALPYWDYTDPAQRQLPRIFREPKVRVNARWEDDPHGDERDNPLFERLRAPQMHEGRALSAAAVDTSWFGEVDDFVSLTSGPRGGFGFGGGVGPGARGALEIAPHGPVHTLVGGRIDGRDGLMVHPVSAAFDPVFWVHHANVDRLWRRWLCSRPRNWGAFGTQSELNDWMGRAVWPFKVSANGPQILQPRGAYMRPSALPYVYEGEFLGCPDPTLPPQTKMKGAGALAVSQMVRGFETVAEVGILAGDLEVPGPIPATVVIPLGSVSEGGSKPRSARSLLQASVPLRPVRLFVDISSLQAEDVGTFGYDVFVNLPAGEALDRRSPAYVGVLDLFGALEPPDTGAGAHQYAPRPQTFDVTARALAGRQNELQIALAPFALRDDTPPAAAAAAGLIARRVTVRLVRGTPYPVR